MNELIETFHRADDDTARVAVICAIADKSRASILAGLRSDPSGKSQAPPDRSVTRFLAQVARDPKESDDIRLCAYLTLHEMTGRTMPDVESVVNLKPNDFDDSFLRHCSH